MIDRKCAVCGKSFKTKYSRQNICGFSCQQVAGRERSRRLMRIKRMSNRKNYEPCYFCGFELTETHHDQAGVFYLCPNHHRIITRGIKTFEDLIISFKK